MTWGQKEHYRDQQMEKYGLSRISNDTDITGRGGYDTKAEEAAILRAINNDFDIRESMKYGRNANNKHFDDFKRSDFATLHDATLGARAIEKHGMKTLGDDVVGEKVRGRGDYAAVSDSLFNASRDGLISSMKADDEQSDTAITPDVPDEPEAPSAEFLKQKGIKDNWAATYGPGGSISPYKSNFKDLAFQSNKTNPYKATTNVDEYIDNYKSGVKNTFKFKPTIA